MKSTLHSVQHTLRWALLAVLATWLAAASGCQPAPPPAPSAAPPAASSGEAAGPRRVLRVFCAGSLILPFAEVEKAFEAAHPEVDVQNECHGSIQVIRHVTELHKPIDIVATADYALVPMLMYSTNDPDTGLPYADWNIRFAGNRMALAYTPLSRYAGEIQADNWLEILARLDVKIGLADPRFDAAGYRTLMIFTLAENEYQIRGIHDAVIRSAFTWPITRFLDEGFAEITVPEVVEPAPDSRIAVRGSSVQLLALLQSGDIDYAFEYESVIAQHGLESLSLPEAVHLGAPTHEAEYAQVEVKLDFQRFSSVKPVFLGESIGYGITIPSSAPEPELAQQYLAFLFSPEGRAVMEAAHHPLLETLECSPLESIPPLLKAHCQAGG